MTTVEITLSDQLAQEAKRAGLLSPARLERWLCEQLDAMDRMAAVDEPGVMSPEDVAREIAAMRAGRRPHDDR